MVMQLDYKFDLTTIIKEIIMKKLFKSLFISVFLFSFIGCAAKYTIPTDSTNDPEFTGKWSGKHYNEKGKYWRKWVQVRNSDGTYHLTLKYYDKSEKYLNTTIENGSWWIQNGLYTEINPNRMSKPESYKFEFVSKDEIKFSSNDIDSSSDEQIGYSFTDTRVE
jgi:hypothetical protein